MNSFDSNGAPPPTQPRRRGRRPRTGAGAPPPGATPAPTPAPSLPLAPLWEALPGCMIAHRPPLVRRLRLIQGRQRTGQPVDRLLAEVEREIDASRRVRQARQESLPHPAYPEELPVVQRRREILEAIRDHQVVILCGATGSGKTTQLPKLCLELGRGVTGMIGVTQPRRIAARSIAHYLARELTPGTLLPEAEGEEPAAVGQLVGYKVRFHDRVGPGTLIKVMTDGILLAETQGDPRLDSYDTIILDEAHERGITTDFLLGYLQRLLPRRPDLKVVVSSATLDTEKFAAHFGNAPVLEVSGRTYPVELRYRPLVHPDDPDAEELELNEAIVAAVAELDRAGPGDVLVFLPGEREIRDAAEALRKHHPPNIEILPLYSRLSTADQDRIFQPHRQKRRVVLATNVAETSLTVPGIRYVVDSGMARISRYSGRSGVQRLPVEKISRASADQRQGRCGRVAAGICIRLYAEEDFAARPLYTEPEILRSSLASVILQMRLLNLGEPERFPFVDPPHAKALREGVRLLQELGALDRQGEITEVGRQLARLPLDPRLGRMILAAREGGCLEEVLVIAAALSTQDPREQPAERREAARQAHQGFNDPLSDFMTLINLWRFTHELEHRTKSRSAFRRALLQEHYLSPWRVREWREVHGQLRRLVTEMGLRPNQAPGEYPQIHQSLLAGLLGRIGLRVEQREYAGTHQTRFLIHPASGVRKQPPQWLVAGELVETSQLFARTCARIEPEWIEPIAGELCRRSHSEPRYEAKRGQVVASERVTLYGLTIVAARPVPYAPIDPVEARRIFIQAALVEGEMRSNAPFYQHNLRLVAEIREWEQKTRRRDLLDDGELFAFYDALIPEGIASTRELEGWRRQVERGDPRHLFMEREGLLQGDGTALMLQDYPGHLTVAGHELALEYHFEPGRETDGVSVIVPLPLLNQLPEEPFQWLVPGLLEKKLHALLKGLPQSLRRPLVPLPETVAACLEELRPRFAQGPLLEALGRALVRRRGVTIPGEAWRPWEEMPDHLRMHFRLLAADGRSELARGRDLHQLRGRLAGEAETSFRELPKGEWEREGVSRWDFGPLPEEVRLTVQGRILTGYPALAAEGEQVALRLLDSAETARHSHRGGLRRLFLRQLPALAKQLARDLPLAPNACLTAGFLGGCGVLRREIAEAAAERAFFPEGAWTVRTPEAFATALERGRPILWREGERLARAVSGVLEQRQECVNLLKRPGVASQLRTEVEEQLEGLIFPGFVLTLPPAWLEHLPRYVQGARLRVERALNAPAKESAKAQLLQPLLAHQRRAKERFARTPPTAAQAEAWERFRWLLEEYRVSLFAQELKTAVPVSPQRLEKAWREVEHA